MDNLQQAEHKRVEPEQVARIVHEANRSDKPQSEHFTQMSASFSRDMIAKAALRAERNVMILFADRENRSSFLKETLQPANHRGVSLYPVELGSSVSNRPIIHRVHFGEQRVFDIYLLAGPDFEIEELPDMEMLLDLSLLPRLL